jgi:hypothetical protein
MLDEIYETLTGKRHNPSYTFPIDYFIKTFDVTKNKEIGKETIRITRRQPEQEPPYTYNPDITIEYNPTKKLCFELRIIDEWVSTTIFIRAGNLCKDPYDMSEWGFYGVIAIPTHRQTVMFKNSIDYEQIVKYIDNTTASITRGDYSRQVLPANDTWTLRCKDCQCKIDREGNKIR